MPKSKKRKKHGVAVRPPAGPRVLAQSAAQWPLHECLMTGDWQNTQDLTQIVVARRNPANGVVVGGLFLVDLGCLGVKDASVVRFVSVADYQYTLQGSITLLQAFTPVSLDLAAKVLHEAAAYARTLGFLPHPDYRDALPLLQGARPENATETVPLGVDGKPFYISGPNDHPGKILRQLEKAVGPGNFDYTIVLPPGAPMPPGVDPAKVSTFSLGDSAEFEEERLSWLPVELVDEIEALEGEDPERAVELFRPWWPIAVANEFLEQAPPGLTIALADAPNEQLPERLREQLPAPMQAYFDGLLNAIPASIPEYLDLLDGIDASDPGTDDLPPEILAQLGSADPRDAASVDEYMLEQVINDLSDIVPERTLKAIRGQPVEAAIPALLAALPDDLRGILAPQMELILTLRAQQRAGG